MPTGAEIQAANEFLADQAWGGANMDQRRRSQSASTSTSSRSVVRNESYEAIAGVPLQVGVRWAINNDCSARPLTVRVVEQPRFGRATVQPVNYLLPNTAIDGRNPETMRRCAGLPTVGQAIYYEAPEGSGNYYDTFAVETNGGLRFNYRILVERPRG